MELQETKIVLFTCLAFFFACGPVICLAVDIYDIEIDSGKAWCDGVPEDKPYYFWLRVNTNTDVNAVTVTPPAPANSPISLVKWEILESFYMWSFEDEDLYEYNSLPELRSDFPLGDYTFSFNNGTDSVTLTHNPSEPNNFADIIEPNHNANDISRAVAIKWQSCVGYGDGLRLLLWDETQSKLAEYTDIDIEQTSYTPKPLDMNHLYGLEMSLFEGISGQPYHLTTDQGDDFDYYDLFAHSNVISFTTSSISSPPYYQYQIVPFLNPDIEYVFIRDTNSANSWAGEDYGAVRITGILNENEQHPGLLFPESGFDYQQGAFLVYDVNDESGNGALCALTSEFPESEGGPGQSGLPTDLNGATLTVDIAFIVPGRPSVSTLSKALGFWLLEADGDNFEMDAIMDLSSEWQSYTINIDDMADYGTYTPGGGVFGDSPVALLAIEFEDPNVPEGLDTIIYFVDNFLIANETVLFFEDFEAKCPSSNEADLNGDCEVNLKDFATFADAWLWQSEWK